MSAYAHTSVHTHTHTHTHTGGHLTKAELAAMVKDLQDKEEQLQTLIATAKSAGKKTEKQEAGLVS